MDLQVLNLKIYLVGMTVVLHYKYKITCGKHVILHIFAAEKHPDSCNIIDKFPTYGLRLMTSSYSLQNILGFHLNFVRVIVFAHQGNISVQK